MKLTRTRLAAEVLTMLKRQQRYFAARREQAPREYCEALLQAAKSKESEVRKMCKRCLQGTLLDDEDRPG